MNPTDLAATLELLAQALRMLPAGAGAGLAVPPAPQTTPQRTLGEWLDVHEAALREHGYKAQTIRNRRATIAHLRRLWGGRQIGSIKPREVSSTLRSEFLPQHSSTAARVLAELRTAYEDAIVEGWTETNPAAHVRLPAHQVIRARLKFETWLAMRELSQASPQRWVESLLLLALVTGQRRGDLAKMRFDDVRDGHLHIEQAKEAGKGYGARIALPLALRLDAIGLTLADVIEHCRGSAKPGPTLLRKAGGGAIEESSLSARFHEHLVAVCGPDAYAQHQHPSLHEVRSLAARLYTDQGEDVQTLLGHKHADMTELYRDDRGLSAHVYKRLALSGRPLPGHTPPCHPN